MTAGPKRFVVCLANYRSLRPSNLRMATWALQGAFSKDIYTLGLKQYLTNRAMAYMDVERKVELADFAPYGKSARTSRRHCAE